MNLLSPETIQAFGVAVAAIITAWVGYQGKKLSHQSKELKAQARQIKDLRTSFDDLEGKFDHLSDKYHVSIRHIRDWRWRHQNDDQGPAPLTPPEIAEDVGPPSV